MSAALPQPPPPNITAEEADAIAAFNAALVEFELCERYGIE
jgi:hypothetical protein